MSLKLIQLLQILNENGVEKQIAFQCAPVITGVKVANLLIVRSDIQKELKQMFLYTQIWVSSIYENENSKIYLIYNVKQLENYLKEDTIKEKLHLFGYSGNSLEEFILYFAKRYKKYKLTKVDFPHEIGLFLGYPLEDVEGFMLHNGSNYKYCGYWKVYHNVSQAKILFQRYDKAKEVVLELLVKGFCMQDIVRYHTYGKQKENA